MAYKEKILIIRFSSLGDVILVHPVIKKLSNSNYIVHLLTLKEYSEIFKFNPFLNKIITFDKKNETLFQLIKKIKQENYYKIIDLQKNLRSILIKFFFLKKIISYKKYKFRRFLLVFFKINLLKKNYVIKNYLETLKKLKIKITEKDFNYEVFSLKKYLIKTKNKIIAIAPYAKWQTKIWPYFDKLVEVLSKKYLIVILGSKEDKERKIFKFENNKNVLDLTGKVSILETAGILKQSNLLVTNDSGIMHLGFGCSIPILIILGSTTKEFGFIPKGKNIFIIENKNLKCRPCDYHGKNKCPKSHFKCMKDIKLNFVLKKIEKILK